MYANAAWQCFVWYVALWSVLGTFYLDPCVPIQLTLSQ